MGQSHNPYGFRPAFDDAPVRYHPEASTQTFAKGDAVILVSGAVTIATAASTEILGVAAAPSSGTTSNPVPVWSADNTIFVGKASGANSIANGGVCDIEGATGAMMLNENDTATNVALIINEVDTAEVTTSASKEYRFRFCLHSLADLSS